MLEYRFNGLRERGGGREEGGQGREVEREISILFVLL